MGSIKSVCCEPALPPNFMDGRIKEHKFESFDREPKITNEIVLERMKEFGKGTQFEIQSPSTSKPRTTLTL